MTACYHDGPLAAAAARACTEALDTHVKALETAQSVVLISGEGSRYNELSKPGPHRYSCGSHPWLGRDHFAVDVMVTRRPVGPEELHSPVDDASEHK
jgi:hypothetical protein